MPWSSNLLIKAVQYLLLIVFIISSFKCELLEKEKINRSKESNYIRANGINIGFYGFVETIDKHLPKEIHYKGYINIYSFLEIKNDFKKKAEVLHLCFKDSCLLIDIFKLMPYGKGVKKKCQLSVCDSVYFHFMKDLGKLKPECQTSIEDINRMGDVYIVHVFWGRYNIFSVNNITSDIESEPQVRFIRRVEELIKHAKNN